MFQLSVSYVDILNITNIPYIVRRTEKVGPDHGVDSFSRL